jgi:predicted MFS family arabinose efflux permease
MPISEQYLAQPGARHLGWQVAATTLSRLVMNTARRFVYPYAPVFSRTLGVPLTAITSLIAVNQATGLLSLVFGPLGDRWGYRAMMLAGMASLTIGMFLGGLLPIYGVIIVSLLLAGLCKSLFDPALYAYIGDRVPFAQRGRIIGIVEFAWAGSVLIGIPIAGLLIDRIGWRSPFFVMGGLALLGLVALSLLVEPGRTGEPLAAGKPFLAGWRQLTRSRAAMGALAFGFLLSLANDTLFVIYGVWLEQAFALEVVALGATAIVIGLAELLGEILTATLADRLTLKRAIIIGLALTVTSYGQLPLLAQTLPLALLGMFLIFLFFEFTVVTGISLFTELLPQARGTMLSASVASSSLGRVAGAILGGLVWPAAGLWGICLIAASGSAVALICLLWGLHRWQPELHVR